MPDSGAGLPRARARINSRIKRRRNMQNKYWNFAWQRVYGGQPIKHMPGAGWARGYRLALVRSNGPILKRATSPADIHTRGNVSFVYFWPINPRCFDRAREKQKESGSSRAANPTAHRGEYFNARVCARTLRCHVTRDTGCPRTRLLRAYILHHPSRTRSSLLAIAFEWISM